MAPESGPEPADGDGSIARRVHSGRPLRTAEDARPDPKLWAHLNDHARRELIKWANSGQEILTAPVSHALVDARKPVDGAHHPWFVSVKPDEGAPRVLQIGPQANGPA